MSRILFILTLSLMTGFLISPCTIGMMTGDGTKIWMSGAEWILADFTWYPLNAVTLWETFTTGLVMMTDIALIAFPFVCLSRLVEKPLILWCMRITLGLGIFITVILTREFMRSSEVSFGAFFRVAAIVSAFVFLIYKPTPFGTILRELKRRKEKFRKNPNGGSSWDEVKQRIREQRS